jgi:mRNA interferase MazF
VKGYSFEVVLPPGLRTHGAVLTDHLKSLDWTVRRAVFIEEAPEDVVEEITAKLMPLLGAE